MKSNKSNLVSKISVKWRRQVRIEIADKYWEIYL